MNDTYRWWNGKVERCTVHRISDGRAFVSWPDSVREIPRLGAGLYVRPAGWVDAGRLGSSYETATAHAIYHEFVDAP